MCGMSLGLADCQELGATAGGSSLTVEGLNALNTDERHKLALRLCKASSPGRAKQNVTFTVYALNIRNEPIAAERKKS